MELETFYGAMAVIFLVCLMFVLAILAELKHENKSYIGRIKYLEDLLRKE